MPAQPFERILGLRECTALVIGSIIGSGIFIKPAVMAAALPSTQWILVTWVIAGAITLCGALTNAEAISMFPETGGQVVLFEKMYGKSFAFLYAWSSFAVFNTAGNASIAFVSARYLSHFFPLYRPEEHIILSTAFHLPGIGTIEPLRDLGLKILTIVLLLLVSLISAVSSRESARLQNILTALKVAAIMMVAGGGLFHAPAYAGDHQHSFGPVSLPGLVAALTSAFWAFDGWNNISFVAGEVKSPQKNIPGALALGISVCTLVYLLFQLALDRCMGLQSMSQSSSVAGDAGRLIWGPAGAAVLAAIIALSTTGTLGANVFSTARVTFAMGSQNRWFAPAAGIHPRYNTPAAAIGYNLAWSVLLTMSGSFDILTDMLIFVTWFFYGMSALGVMLLRRRMPDHPRSYRTVLYPWPAVIFVLFCFSYLLSSLYYDISGYLSGESTLIRSVFGALIALAGLPLLWTGRRNLENKPG